MPVTNLPLYSHQWVQSKIFSAVLTETKILSYLKAFNLVQRIPKGVENYQYSKIKEMTPGQISLDIMDMPTAALKFTSQTAQLAYFTTRVSIPKNMADAYQNNQLYNTGDLAQLTIDNVIKNFVVQIDKFLAWGDAMSTGDLRDPQKLLQGKGNFKGIFNGGTTFNGGIGGDNDLTAAGDFIHTVYQGIANLKNANFTSNMYFLFSDIETKMASAQGAHLITTNAFNTEQSYILKEIEGVRDWLATPNMADASGNHYLLVTTPRAGPTGENQPNYRLLTSYDFEVIPLYNGGYSPNLTRDFAIIWSGALDIINKDAFQVTGALTI